MSKPIFELDATVREDMGKGASRRLRRLQNELPAILYGGKENPLPIKLVHNKVLHALEHEAFFSHILTININNKKQKVVLKDLQRHPYKRSILHMDFQRVTDNYIITMRVPIHYINEEVCKGVKDGGRISHHLIDLNIRCKAKDLPEFVTVDLTDLDIDQALHLSDLKLPEGLEIPELSQDISHNLAVVSIHSPKKAAEEASSEEEKTPTAAASENKETSEKSK